MAATRRPARTDRVVERAAELAKPKLGAAIRRLAPNFKTIAAMHIAEHPKVKDEVLAEYLVALAELFLAPLLRKAWPAPKAPENAAWFDVQVRVLVGAEGRTPTAEDVGGLLEQLFHGTAGGTPLGIQESRGLAVAPAE